mgnify:CR=1 FL=1
MDKKASGKALLPFGIFVGIYFPSINWIPTFNSSLSSFVILTSAMPKFSSLGKYFAFLYKYGFSSIVFIFISKILTD